MRLGHPSCVFPADMRGNPTPASTPRPSPGLHGFDKDYASSPSSMVYDIIGDDQANDLLSKYRIQKQAHFPFVIIPPDTDVAVLREQSPFLLLCILTASLEHDPKLQETLEVRVREEIARRLIVGLERDMDLLQGLLVQAAWHHYHWKSYYTQIYMLLQMVMMVVVDLGLDRQEILGFRMRAIPGDAGEGENDPRPGSACGIKEPIAQTAASQRALLGCYYLCSNSSLFRQQLCMQHTPWIDQCAKTLAERAEYPTDLKLNQLEVLTSSAYGVVDAFLETPLKAVTHLTSHTYAIIWYCLLVLSKLSILFHPSNLLAPVDQKKIHDRGVAIIQKFTDLSVEKDDFWIYSRKVIGNMLTWLEKSMPSSGPHSSSRSTMKDSHPDQNIHGGEPGSVSDLPQQGLKEGLAQSA